MSERASFPQGNSSLRSGDAINFGEKITLSDGLTYFCARTADLDNRHFLFLVNVAQPYNLCFAEQLDSDLRIVENRAEKQHLFAIFRDSLIEEYGLDQGQKED
ncbi:hypothetical protein IKF15_01830 [Candidatus Saccharibacteria bacterium]|nr:hypothetical protein [Candidatus Saccharibacteria bacterium]